MAQGLEPEREFTLKNTLGMCLTDAIVKGGSGALIGTISSMIVLRRRRWPIIVGIGMGLGFAWANCEYELKRAI